MATTVTYTQQFPASPSEVWVMLSDEEYVHTKGMQSGSLEVNQEVTVSEDTTVIISRRLLPAKLPGFAKKFVGEELILNETQTWGPAKPDGSRDANFVVDFGGQPMAYSGQMALRPNADGTEVITMGRVSASVPFVGGKIEKVAVEWTEKYLRKEEKVAAEWLATHS